MSKGWFRVEGIRPEGDRDLTEQLRGLAPALAEAKGKTILDLGCAEGCISAEFAKAGSTDVLGIELLKTHLAVARKVCAGLPVRFVCAHLRDYALAHEPPEQFDIVLALGVIHKLNDPNEPMLFAARSCRDLLCFRAPSKKDRLPDGDYLIKSKFTTVTCNVPKLMREQGFVDEGTHDGVRGESVQYFRRVK